MALRQQNRSSLRDVVDPMKVLLVTPWFPTEQSPESGVFVLRDALALAANNDVTVLHLDWNAGAPSLRGIDEIFELRRLQLNRRVPGDYLRARRVVREFARSAAVVHTHALPGLLPFFGARPGGRTPWVHTEHWSGVTSPELLTRTERVLRGILLRGLRGPDAVVVQCRRLASPIGRLRSGRIDIIPCIVDEPDRVIPPPRDPDLLRLAGVGGLVERKGPLIALGAVRKLCERGIPTRLTWVGGGPLAEVVQARAQEWGIADYLRLVGVLSPDGVAKELDAADVFVLPTLGDNFCVVVAEALVHGRPVVSGSETGAVDYARPHVSEFVHEYTADAFADAIERVRAKTAGLDAAEIASTVRGAFSSEFVAGRLVALYREILDT